MSPTPKLFGVRHSNRDFSKEEAWGKNQFNSSFPAALVCYMQSIDLPIHYITSDSDYSIQRNLISGATLFDINPLDDSVYYGFESAFTPFREFALHEDIPRADLVVSKVLPSQDGQLLNLRGLEIKLTTVPDYVTSKLGPNQHGPELVLRPDSIVYLALSIASSFAHDRSKLLSILDPVCASIYDWLNPSEMHSRLAQVVEVLKRVLQEQESHQQPFLLQPVWRSQERSFILEENCLDAFVWSDFAFTHLFIEDRGPQSGTRISRPKRTAVWLLKMLYDYAKVGEIDRNFYSRMGYGTQTDKAFAVNGSTTRKYLGEENLDNMRIGKDAISKIILGGGEKLLSPERRFDAAVVTTPDLF